MIFVSCTFSSNELKVKSKVERNADRQIDF